VRASMGLRVVTFKVEEDFLEKMDLAARRLGLSRSDLIREAIENYLKIYIYGDIEEVTHKVRLGEIELHVY